VWDAGTGHMLAKLTGHTARLWDAAFSPDGNRVVTASQDGTSKIYNMNFKQLLGLANRILPVDSGN